MASIQVINFCKLSESAKCPKRGTENSAGYDLYSTEAILIEPFSRNLVGTGIAIAIPSGYYGRIAPRSGLSVKGIDIGAGVIDIDYRGEVKVLMINNSKQSFIVNAGDRIAQLLIEKITHPDFIEVDRENISDTSRGGNGFGSTGK